MESGAIITARKVVIALGFKYFRNIPVDLVDILPLGRWGHTCDEINLEQMRDKRCLIVGGRQSAFEWAALLQEAGAQAVHVVHRHETPAFEEADWSWVPPIVDRMVAHPGWFRNLSLKEKKEIDLRLWAEGRLKVEPWLEERVHRESISLWPNTEMTDCQEREDGSLNASLSNGKSIAVEHIILATGYRVNILNIPFLKGSPLLLKIVTNQGFPVLDENMQTTVPGLFMTSMAAVQDFGPFFAFTVSVRTSAQIIGAALRIE